MIENNPIFFSAFRVALADKDYANEKAGRNMREKINLFFD
jgi:hypothetical protein